MKSNEFPISVYIFFFFLLSTWFFKQPTTQCIWTLHFCICKWTYSIYTVTLQQTVTNTYCTWQHVPILKIQSRDVQDCVFGLSQDELSWAFIYPGIFIYLFIFSLSRFTAYVFLLTQLYFTVQLVHTYSGSYHRSCSLWRQCSTVRWWAASCGQFSVEFVAQKHLSSS